MLRLLAVASEKRSPIFPDVPTLKEKGWDVVLAQWRGVLAPKGTPPDRIRALADAFQKGLATDSWKAFRDRTQSVDLFLQRHDLVAGLTQRGGESLVLRGQGGEGRLCLGETLLEEASGLRRVGQPTPELGHLGLEEADLGLQLAVRPRAACVSIVV